MLAINSILHFVIDGICAYAMLGTFSEGGYYPFLFYNLFAFALQMPLGAIVDLVCSKLPQSTVIAKRRFYWAVTLLGILFVIIGMYAGPYALGAGNALFHVGGGVNAIFEDDEKKYGGRGLGIFVAPGAMGLFVGKILSGFPSFTLYIRNTLIGISLLLVLIGFIRLYYEERHLIFIKDDPAKMDQTAGIQGDKKPQTSSSSEIIGTLITALACFVVVIVRSYVGIAIQFSWNSKLILAFFAVLAVVLGKVAGGFLAHRIGQLKAICISLGLAAVFYCLSDIPFFGIAALFWFNMTMPITLYMMAKRFPKMPGFAFGLLTFAIFIGYFIYQSGITVEKQYGDIGGMIGSLVSLLILVGVIIIQKKLEKKRG